MKKQFRGIALLLFGILLAITSIPMENFMPGEYYMLPCLIGVVVGVVGVVGVVFAVVLMETVLVASSH